MEAGAAEGRVTVNRRRPKWDVGDVAALQAMTPLGGGFVPWTSFSLRPSALLTVLNEIDFRRPRLCVELGSGASTVMTARLLARSGDKTQRLVSVESDAGWAAYLYEILKRDGTSDMVDLLEVPLTPWTKPQGPPTTGDLPMPTRWFDPAPLLDAVRDEPIDLLLVDGPPGSKRLSRFPAVPELRERLADEAVVILDDARRPEEAEIASRWSQLLDIEFVIYERLALAVGRLGGGYTLLGS